MPNSTLNPDSDTEGDHLDPEQAHYDSVFNELTSAENLARDGQHPDPSENTASSSGDDYDIASGEAAAGAGAQSNAASPADLRSSEEGSGDSLYNDSDGKQNLRSRLRSKAKGLLKHKWLVGGAAAGGGGFIIILLLILFFLGSMKIPNLGEHIAAYQFARNARTYSEHVSAITTEDIETSTASDSALATLSKTFSGVKDKTWGSMWNKLNNYRPDKIVEKMQESGRLDFKYQECSGVNCLWKKKLTAVVINGEEIPVNNQSLWNKVFHPLQNRADRLQMTDQMNQALADAMQGRSVIIRGAVAKAIRDELGIRLKWWDQAKYSGKDQAAADAEEQLDSMKQIAQGEQPVPAVTDSVNTAEQDAQKAVNDCMSDPKCAAETMTNGGVVPAAEQAINNDLKSSTLGDIANFLGPFTALVPACLIYDGSLDSTSAQTQIDQTNAIDQRAFYAVETAADQQKYGDTNGEAVGAMNDKIGDITQSIPELRAWGQPVDTTSAGQPQASLTGDYSFLDVILPQPVADFIDSVAQPACPLLTNPTFNLVTGALSLLGGGVKAIVSRGADVAVTDALKTYVSNFLKNTFTIKEAKKLGITVGGVTALTIMAQMIVRGKMGATNTALSTGPTFDESADAGGNLNANEIARRFYGRPLTNTEVAAGAPLNQNFQANQLAQESAFQRYLAVTNPDSLITHVGMGVQAHLNTSIFSGLLNMVGKIFSPFSSLVQGLASVSHTVALAASANPIDTQNYGIVQWGWSNDEEDAVQNDPSYRPLENQQALETRQYCKEWNSAGTCLQYANLVDEPFLQKYNKCFGYDGGGNPDPTDTMGYMIYNKLIKRDKYGDVQDTGPNITVSTSSANGITTIDSIDLNTSGTAYCSRADIGIDNTTAIPGPGNQPIGDFVFRYRLEKSNELTIDQLENIQDINAQGTAAANPSGTVKQ